MQNQRAHGDDPTGPDRAFDRSNFTNEFVDARRRQATEPMRPRYHAERPVVGTTVVEVHAKRLNLSVGQDAGDHDKSSVCSHREHNDRMVVPSLRRHFLTAVKYLRVRMNSTTSPLPP